MTSAASVRPDERVRLFCGLRLPDASADALEAWQRGLDGGRPVPRHNLHFTLAFLGWQPGARVEEVVETLRRRCAGFEPFRFELVSYRETRSAGMLVFAAHDRAEALAFDLQRDLLGAVERERWLPHVTVFRFRNRRPRLRPELPELGPVVTSDAAAYLSLLRPTGAEYVVLESVRLGGN